jgi:hypothetical protein
LAELDLMSIAALDLKQLDGRTGGMGILPIKNLVKCRLVDSKISL